ncbi:MAG: flagellar basal body rod protein FlgC [Alphaproteobacteria bacterium]|jgi:flagellar basal-body rod protein FlgC|nr:flagellar basal body rod protein FlgC [Alphaproteobacteria bacterium]MBT4017948.1 flagellar basal body rod protein FlgC [Alphaproteobacteria bacterium]MBT4966401.1 flagellar basal body rod protein FlgC [Alphaproteobacteria bacterium]MBT5917745.1 flagellar basal body rod protein FlgC [Alphaproteobacteria bacterium]MBT6385436.1 flagellar basal body rod protein FlgC [Alphaproteobacteria bacterium]
MELLKSIFISAAGMRTQGQRMQVISENVANADSMPQTPGADPYRRKLVTFRNELDRETGVKLVKLNKVSYDESEFKKRNDPYHPGADKDGYVKIPNVNALIEMMDMRTAQRSYEANLNMVDTAKKMLSKTIDILR